MAFRKVVITIICALINTQASHGLTGVVKTVAGGGEHHIGRQHDCPAHIRSKDGSSKQARFSYPWGIAYDHKRNFVYVADCGCPDTLHANDKIRKIDLEKEEVTTLAGGGRGYKDGVGEAARFSLIAGMRLDAEGETLYIADSANRRIRSLNIDSGSVETVAGTGEPGRTDGSADKATFDSPQDVVFYEGDQENMLIVADTDNHCIRTIGLSSKTVKTLAGKDKGFQDGIGTTAKFYHPTSITIDRGRHVVFISDHYNHAIRKLDMKTKRVTTLSGGKVGFKSGHISQSLFYYPEGIAYDNNLDILYFVEFENNAIRAISRHGHVTLIAGGSPGKNDGVGKLARLYHPTRVAFDEDSKTLYVTDQYNHLIRSVSTVGSRAADPDASMINQVHRHIDSYGLVSIPIYGIIALLMGAFFIRPVLKKCCFLRNVNAKHS